MGRGNYRRGYRNKVFRIHNAKERRSKKYVIERFKRAMIAMKKTWSIGERIFGNDYKRREKMFDTLVGSGIIWSGNMGMEE